MDENSLFPRYIIKEIEESFITIFPLFMCNIKYHLENKYFKNTILEAYDVYVRYNGIYIKFVKPNDSYICENIDNELEIYLLDCNYSPGDNFNEYIPRLLCELEKYINGKKSLKSYLLNKYGELIKKSQKELETIEKDIIVSNIMEMFGNYIKNDDNCLYEKIEKLKKEKLKMWSFEYEVLKLVRNILYENKYRLEKDRNISKFLGKDSGEIEMRIEKITKDLKTINEKIDFCLKIF